MSSSFADELTTIALSNYCRSPGAMFGAVSDLAPGAGVILRSIRYAIYMEDNDRFTAAAGAVLVLTHECDIDQDNRRPFNKHFVGVPLIFLTEFAAQYEASSKQEEARRLVVSIVKGEIQRVFYIPPPPISDTKFQGGAFIYLNTMTSTHVNQITGEDKRLCVLSSYGLLYADLMLQQHFFRPKADALVDPGPAYRQVSITARR